MSVNKVYVVIIRGLPGSGKSTIAKELAEITGMLHVETDMYFEKNGEYKFNPELLPEAHAWCQEEARKALKSGKGVIVSNTFTRVWEMQPYLDMAEEFGANRLVIKANGNFQNVHGVPDHAIQRMKERWEKFEGD